MKQKLNCIVPITKFWLLKIITNWMFHFFSYRLTWTIVLSCLDSAEEKQNLSLPTDPISTKPNPCNDVKWRQNRVLWRHSDVQWRQGTPKDVWMTPNDYKYPKKSLPQCSKRTNFVALFREARPHTMSSMIYYDTKRQPWHQWRRCDTKWRLSDALQTKIPLKEVTTPMHTRRLILDIWVLNAHLVIPWPQGTLHDVNVCSSDAKWRQTTKVVWVMHCECDITIMCKKLIFDRVCTHFMTPEMSWHDLQWRQIFLHLPSDTMTAAWHQDAMNPNNYQKVITLMCKKLIFDHVCTHFMTPKMSWHELQWHQVFLHLPSDTMTAAWRRNDEQWHQDSVRRVIDLVKSASMNKL